MSSIKKAWDILNKKQKKGYLILFIIQFIGSILELVGVSMLLPFLQLLLNPGELLEQKLMKNIMDTMNIHDIQGLVPVLLIFMISVFIIKNLYLVWMNYIRYQIIWKSELEVESRLIDFYISKPYTFFSNHNPAEMQRMILIDVGNVFTVMENIFMMLSESITAILLFVFLFISDASTTMTLLVLICLFILLYFKVFKKRLFIYGKIVQEKGGEVLRNISNIFHNIKEVKVYGKEEYFASEFKKSRIMQINMMKRSVFFQQVPKYFLELICTVGILSILLIRCLMGEEIGAMAAQVSIFAVAAYRILPSANRINANMAYIMGNRASVELIYEWCKEEQGEDTVGKKVVRAKKDEIVKGEKMEDITLKNVSFWYEKGGRKILDNVYLKIKAGSSIAFTGGSGEGKTTTVDLILGILKPALGEIYYGDDNIEKLGREWSLHLGYIPQNIYLTDGTLRENIAFGIEDPDDEKIWAALKEAQLYDYVKQSPLGLDSKMGEGGIRLSGGQRQRIGIARALYNAPDILVLDEATSALDGETEKAVMSSINYLKGKKTLIIIAHRLSTIEKCDVVYEIADGQINKIR